MFSSGYGAHVLKIACYGYRYSHVVISLSCSHHRTIGLRSASAAAEFLASRRKSQPADSSERIGLLSEPVRQYSNTRAAVGMVIPMGMGTVMNPHGRRSMGILWGFLIG